MAKISKLGRGLDILLGQVPSTSDQADSENNLKMLNIAWLQRGKFQPRDDIDPDTLNELASSITSQGVIQPLVVRKVGYDKYEIIAGERRWRAAKIAGLNEVPVIIRKIDDQVALAIGLIENIQRESLTPLEEAKALQQLIEDFKMTHEKVSSVVGRSRSTVSNLIRLLQLNDAVKQLLSSGDIEMGHARALLSLTKEQQLDVANQVIKKSLSVRQTEELVKKALNPIPKKSTSIEPRILELMQTLSKKLASKTEIKPNGNQWMS
ncbi:MAG: Chromosome (plasmid) partitioning protein ParB [Candidatus Ruthia sp. Apha_13_S6]|nr:Chromosome (plasmid) partitioning protein ParB [Candidatus Ruthia sp. Apha_13_S6]